MNKSLNILVKIGFKVLVIILLYSPINSRAQVVSDEKIKVAYTYQFAQNIAWPNEQELDTFRIAVFSDNQSLILEFNEIAKAKSLKNKPIVVYQVLHKSKFAIKQTNILYVDKSFKEFIPSLFQETQYKATLLITEECELKEFVMINFIYRGSKRNKISFELNKENIETNHYLLIQPKLLLLGGSKLDIANLYQKQEEKLRNEQDKVEKQRQILDSQSIEIERQKQDILSQSNDIIQQQREIELQKRNLNALFMEIHRQQQEVNYNLAVLKMNRIEIDKQQKIIISQVQEVEQRNQILEQQKLEIQNQKDKIMNQGESITFQEKTIQTQRKLLIFTLSSIILAICLIMLILIGYRNKQKANRVHKEKSIAIEKQEKEIHLQALQIETTNKELELQNHYLEETIRLRTEDYRLAKEKAEEADKLKSAFLANMSHEIRTPLNAIVGFSQLLSNQTDASDEIIGYSEIIRDSSNDLLRLINDIIDIAKIESGQIQFSISNYNLYLELENINHFFSKQILLSDKKEKLKLIFSPDKKYPNLIVKVDPYRLKQVINNLLSNAIKFTPSGSIEFGYWVDGQIINFFVKDTGIGIPSEFHNSIFQRFVKINQSDQQLYSGTGLGLAISKSLIEMHGGKIWFESIPDIGTQFYFTIPLVQDDTTNEEVLPELKKVSFVNKTVLICDDDYNSRQLLNSILTNMNINTISACDGIEAIELFKKNPNIDLILLDIQMPRLNGYKTLTAIRKISTKRIPIIAQTAFAMSHEIKKIMNSGFDDYISKPIIQDQLENILSKRI